MKERTVAELYDGVLIPALILAERDRHRGELSPERQEFIDTTIRDWIEELAGRHGRGRQPGRRDGRGKAAADRLVCVPAHDVADELAGHMFAQLAVRGGTPTVLEYDLPRSEVLRRLAELGAEQVLHLGAGAVRLYPGAARSAGTCARISPGCGSSSRSGTSAPRPSATASG